MKSDFGDEFLPKRHTLGSAGYDFVCPYDVGIEHNRYTTIDTGIHLTDDDITWYKKWVMLIFPRSSYGFKYGLRFANTVCVIDMDYRDSIKLSVCGDYKFDLKKGERFAQGIIIPCDTFKDEVVPTDQRKGGIGSTGV